VLRLKFGKNEEARPGKVGPSGREQLFLEWVLIATFAQFATALTHLIATRFTLGLQLLQLRSYLIPIG